VSEANASSMPRAREFGKGHDRGTTTAEPQHLAPTAKSFLAHVKPVANWADAALNTAYKDIYFSFKRKDSLGAARAKARLAKLRLKLGLQG
jgi:hypothetical protein